jgi:enoyl-CoA hydratase
MPCQTLTGAGPGLPDHRDVGVSARRRAREAQVAERIAAVPKNQLMMQKPMANQAYDAMGMASTQRFATLFVGITRHSPEGVWFKRGAEEVGSRQAVRERNAGGRHR